MESEKTEDPLWLTWDATAHCIARRIQIEQELLDMGADREYCMQYFQSGGGHCEKVVGGKCVRHRAGHAPLPRGKICAHEFASSAADLRRRVSEIETERRRLKREWDSLKTEQNAAVFLDDHAARLESINERKFMVRNDMTHCFKVLRELMGERLALLECDPVDATAWHETVTTLLAEKIALLEQQKLGVVIQPETEGGL